jgi:urease accessory protein
MKRVLSPLVALTAGSAVVLGTHPVFAHGTATGGALGGLNHPLLGFDHLLMLMAAGTAASFISSQLLLWALGGAVIGAAVGFTGFTMTSAEVLAALAISAVGGVILLAGRFAKITNPNLLTTISGAVVATGISIHAMLHGLEAPKDGSTLLWWSGALVSSALVCGGTALLQKKLPLTWTKAAAIAFLAIGGLLAFAPLALLAGGAGA